MLSKMSVRKPYTVVVAVILVLILGVISFVNLNTDLLPNIDLPFVVVMTTYPGASPEEVEMIVTKPLEQILATVSNIKHISSVSSENSSVVILEFNNDTNMDSATIEINGFLDIIKGAWDDGVGSPMLLRLNPDMLPIMVAAVDIEGMDMIEISQKVEEEIIPELESIPGLASASATGLLEERVEILLLEDKIEALNRKLLEEIDGELAEAEDKLKEAQEELEDGILKLDSEEDSQTSKLAQGEDAIKEAKKQMADAEAELLVGERELEKAEMELRGKLVELNVQKTNMDMLLAGLDEIESKVTDTKDGVFDKSDEIKLALLSIINSLPDLDNIEDLPLDIEDIDLDVKGGLGKNLDELEDSLKSEGELAEDDIIALLDNVRDELGSANKLLNMGSEEINKGLETIEEKRLELSTGKLLLADKKEELGKKEQELKLGLTIMGLEMGRAREKLTEGEELLNEKLEEFEEARDEAFKKASLEGVITKDMLSGILAAQNFSMPAGTISEEGNDYLVKVGDSFDELGEIENLMLFDTGDKGIGKIYLRDVADIATKDNSTEGYAKVNGNDAIIINFQKQSTFSTAEVSENIRKKFEELESDIDKLNLTALMDQGIYIDIVVDSVLDNVLYGGILAILILMLFLKDIRPTFIIAVSIPISLVFAVAMMYFTGVSINIISLAGLALGVGMLVDNSIVVIENIYRLRLEGMSTREASIEGAREIAGAIIASTLTTAAVFLPIVFVKGISRQIFVDMGLTITYSLVASLIVALTLVPMMASNLLEKSKEKKSRFFDWFTDKYVNVLKWSLNHRALIMIFVILLAGLSVLMALSLGTGFIPDMDAPQMSVSIQMPRGSAKDDTIDMTNEVIDRLLEIEEIDTVGAFHGGVMGDMSFMAGGGQNFDSMNLYLLLDEKQVGKNKDVERKILDKTKDLDAEVGVSSSNMDLSALGGSGVELMIKGRDMDRLQDISRDLGEILEGIEGTIDVSYGQEETLTEMRIVVDKEKAMEKGLTVAQVFSKLSKDLSDDRPATILSTENKDYPMIVLDDKSMSLTRDDLKDIELEGTLEGEEVTLVLGDIAEIVEAQGLSSINRDSQERYLSVTAAIDADHNIGIVSREFEDKIKDYELPQGYRIEFAGENENIQNALGDLFYMLLIAIAFIYLIMVAQFQSLLSPFIVMFTIPLAFTGGFIALYILGYEVSVISMLGFLVLSGIVVNNGIVFVDFTNQLRQSGLSKRGALVEAGRTRLRPILMTALTTILGLSTLSMGVGMGSEMLQPLALVAIGGLIYSTILTLIVIPIMYDILHKDIQGPNDLLHKDRKSSKDEEVEALEGGV